MAELTPHGVSNPFSTPTILTPKPTRDRLGIRTPSPTPSEQLALSGKKFKLTDLRKKENWKILLIILFFTALTVLLIVYQDDIVNALRPTAKWMRDTPGGWLIPIAILIVLSFPPLIGHEIVIVLIGFTWGLGIGFGIAAAGTYIGEVITFYTFKYGCKSRTDKWEQTSVPYGTLARVIREGGISMAIIARYSTIPGHILTALFACCGMDIVTFTIGVFVAFPRQLVTVYFGYALASTDVNGHEPKSKTIVKWTSIVVITVVTIIAMKYIERKEDAVRPDIVYQRRKRRQTKLQVLADIEAQKHDGEDMAGGSDRVSSGPPLVMPTPHRVGVPVYPPHT